MQDFLRQSFLNMNENRVRQAESVLRSCNITLPNPCVNYPNYPVCCEKTVGIISRPFHSHLSLSEETTTTHEVKSVCMESDSECLSEKVVFWTLRIFQGSIGLVILILIGCILFKIHTINRYQSDMSDLKNQPRYQRFLEFKEN